MGKIWEGPKWEASGCLFLMEPWMVLPLLGYDIWQSTEGHPSCWCPEFILELITYCPCV